MSPSKSSAKTDRGPGEPVLTVVVAARRSEGEPWTCLEALCSQADGDVRILLVEDEPAVGAVPARVERLQRPGTLVPELWSEGIGQVTGGHVALTTATTVPDPDWVRSVRAAERDGVVAVGGPVEPGPGFLTVDWAIYLCRYSAHMAAGTTREVDDLPGDNASYDMDVLRTYLDTYTHGFWEPFVHRAMRADGHRLLMDPRCVVRHRAGVGGFSSQRFRHGRVNARLAGASMRGSQLVLRILAAPAVPVLLALRVRRNLVKSGRHQRQLVRSLPWMMWFYACWAAGEVAGYGDVLSRQRADRPC